MLQDRSGSVPGVLERFRGFSDLYLDRFDRLQSISDTAIASMCRSNAVRYSAGVSIATYLDFRNSRTFSACAFPPSILSAARACSSAHE